MQGKAKPHVFCNKTLKLLESLHQQMYTPFGLELERWFVGGPTADVPPHLKSAPFHVVRALIRLRRPLWISFAHWESGALSLGVPTSGV